MGCSARCFICRAFGFVFWFDSRVFMPFLGILFGIEAPGETPATQKKRTSCVNEVQSIFRLVFCFLPGSVRISHFSSYRIKRFPGGQRHYSHSIVPGGFEVMSRQTRFTCFTSFTILVEMTFSTSYGMRAQSAVIPSIEVTARTTTV